MTAKEKIKEIEQLLEDYKEYDVGECYKPKFLENTKNMKLCDILEMAWDMHCFYKCVKDTMEGTT